MTTEKLKPLGRCRRLREQRSAHRLGRERARFAEIEQGYQRAMRALDDNRQSRSTREQQIYRAIRQKPVPVDHLETLRWELATMELEIEHLVRAVDQAKAALDDAAIEVERARETYLQRSQAVRKWDKVIERAAVGEDTYQNRIAEIEQDDATIEHLSRR